MKVNVEKLYYINPFSDLFSTFAAKLNSSLSHFDKTLNRKHTMTTEKRKQPEGVQENILGVLETLFRYKKAILYTCAAAAIISIVVSLLLPVYYKSTSVFYAASTDLASPERIFGNVNAAIEYYGQPEDIDRVITIAESNEVTDYMIDRFKLYERYDIDTTSELAGYYVRLAYFDLYDLSQTKYDAIQLAVEDKDPVVAAEMANAARNKTAEILVRLIKESQDQTLSAYRTSIGEGEKNVVIINDSLQRTRNRFKVYNTKSQSAGISNALQKARSKLLINEIELEEMQRQGSVPRDTIRKRNAIIAGTRYQIEELNKDLDLFNQGMAQVDYLTTLQEEISQQLSEDKQLYKNYLAAYNSTFPTLHVVETARPPIIKSRPIRWLIVAASVFIAFILSILAILLFVQYKDIDWKKIIHAR